MTSTSDPLQAAAGLTSFTKRSITPSMPGTSAFGMSKVSHSQPSYAARFTSAAT